MESEEDMHKKTSLGIVDLVFFNGASNVQNAGKILRAFSPCVTVGHGAEHVASLLFLMFTQRLKTPETLRLCQEDLQYFWFGEVQPLGNVQEV